jgi:hypothetical protein
LAYALGLAKGVITVVAQGMFRQLSTRSGRLGISHGFLVLIAEVKVANSNQVKRKQAMPKAKDLRIQGVSFVDALRPIVSAPPLPKKAKAGAKNQRKNRSQKTSHSNRIKFSF